MSTLLFANNAASTLAGAINNTTTTLNLAAGGGALFPNPTAGQYFVITAIDAATGLLREIMQCTARATDTLTVVRAQEGTTGLNWNAGDLIQNLWTAGQAAQMLQQGQVPSSILYYGADVGAVNAMVVTVAPALGFLSTGNVFEISPGYANTSTSVTLDISTTGVFNVYRSDGTSLQINDIQGPPYKALIAWDGATSKYLLLNPCLWASNPKFAITTDQITTTGPYTFTVPAGVYSVLVSLWGGGGGGGGAGSGTPGGAASGGGSGGFTQIALSVLPGQTISGNIGPGGSAGTPGANGNGGSATTAIFSSVTYTAGGGAGGQSATAGSAQNSVSGGSTINGNAASHAGSVSESGSFSYNGTTAVAQGGTGGNAPGGGGAGGNGSTGAGNPGQTPGGGGAGAGAAGSNENGGGGANGAAWFQY